TRFDLPDIHIDVTCSSGTYIRAIARDLGADLGVGAHLTALRRMLIGSHDVANAVTVAVLDSDPAAVRAAMISTLDALGPMPRIEVSDDEVVHIRHGRALERAVSEDGVVALASSGDLVAIAEAVEGRIRPRKVFI
ncbi:MAG: tRNA pseudouridine(55) synthase TruB, partial [Gemmatimonadetes bacterium]|nr:tRNA pseudouridine(55) synthase TruB [Gemmatimonadota bacterium]